MIHLKYIHGARRYKWAVLTPIHVILPDDREITINAGFETDLSSVPRFLWALFPPYGDFLLAAIVHDWMYVTDYRRKELGDYKGQLYADQMMLKISNKYNKNKLDNYIRYYAVRLFGWTLYKR